MDSCNICGFEIINPLAAIFFVENGIKKIKHGTCRNLQTSLFNIENYDMVRA